MTRITGLACFFLVALRMVIGWHFFIEGAFKVNSHRIGKTSTNTPWTSEGFFREGYGPAAKWTRELLQIDEAHNLERFTIGESGLLHAQAGDWDRYFESFVAHYQFTDDQRQSAKASFEDHKAKLVRWLSGTTPTPTKANLVWGQVELQMTVPQRIAQIQERQKQVAEIMQNQRPAFGNDVDQKRLVTLKAEIATMLADLNKEYERRVTEMRDDLAKLLSDEQKKLGPIPESKRKTRVQILDQFVMWSQLVLGFFLLAGLFNRFSCLLLAAFLLHVTLIAPALPYAPRPPGATGHYLYIDLYIIELIALLALAAIPTSRWFGLDALLSAMWLRRKPPENLRIPARTSRPDAREGKRHAVKPNR